MVCCGGEGAGTQRLARHNVGMKQEEETGAAPRRRAVALVGMPGCGKSTVGMQLARRMGLGFCDSDQWIEAQHRMSVREFFAQHGEEAFRDLETRALRELLAAGGVVLATGGGAVLRAENRRVLYTGACVLYLRSTPEQLWRRLRHDTRRPLLQVPNPQQRLRELYAERDALYRECAHFVVNTRGLSLQMLVNRVQMQLELCDK